MIVVVASLALLASQAAGPDRDRERLVDVLRRLGDDDFETRRKARKDLLDLPLTLAPEIERKAAETADAEVKFSLQGVRVPRAWQFLPCTIGQAQEWIARLEDRGHPQHRATVDAALKGFESLPRETVEGALRGLLDHGGPSARYFVLDGFARFPPRSAAPLVPLLRHHESSVRALEIILATRDTTIVPELLPIFAAGGHGSLEAGRLLVEWGADVEPEAAARAIRASSHLVHLGCRLILRAGFAAEPVLLELLAQNNLEKHPILVALSEVGGPAALEAVRSHLDKEGSSSLRDQVLARMRDPRWALAKLAEIRTNPEAASRKILEDIAATGAPGLRESVLEWIATPDLKVSVLKHALPLLGAVGRREDGALLAERLRDRRIVESAVEGLELLGDPSFAAQVMEAFKRRGGAALLGRSVLSFPLEGLEGDIVELLSDPEGYRWAQPVAYQLAFRRITPPIREALWKVLLEENFTTARFRVEIVRRLTASPSPEDKTWIARLKEQKNVSVRAAGLLFELRGGDASAAAPLVGLLTGASLESTFPDGTSLPDPGTTPAVVAAWEKAVTEQWRAKPAWIAGACWLAGRGNREAADALRKDVDKLKYPLRSQAEAALAALGEDLPIFDRFLASLSGFPRGNPLPQFLDAATPAAKAALLEKARAHLGPASDIALELAALLTLPEAVPLYSAHLRDDTNPNRDDAVAVESIAALGRLRAKAAIPELRLQLRSASPAKRAAAIRALADLDDRASIGAIASLLDDPAVSATRHDRYEDWNLHPPAPRVSRVAVEALERLTGTKTEGAAAVDQRRFWKDWNETHRDARK